MISTLPTRRGVSWRIGLAFLVALFTALPAHADFRVVRVSGDDVLNMRAAPSATARIVRSLSFNARGLADLGKTSGAWRYVRYRGSRGWVHGYYIQGDDPGEKTHYSIMSGDGGGGAAIRFWPSTLSRKIGTIPLTETGVGAAGLCTRRWCRVSYGGVRGWVLRKHLAVWIP